MKIATWNVNGIRARQAQVQEWIERERPDVVCLQEIKAASDQVPAALCEMEGYWCYWHGGKGYSGVGLHVRKSVAPERPVFSRRSTTNTESSRPRSAASPSCRSMCRTAEETSRPRSGSFRPWKTTHGGFRPEGSPSSCAAI